MDKIPHFRHLRGGAGNLPHSPSIPPIPSNWDRSQQMPVPRAVFRPAIKPSRDNQQALSGPCLLRAVSSLIVAP